MVRTKENLKQKAILFRKEGLSYSEILKQIIVAKSTLSLWLRDVGLAKKQKQLISEKRIAGRLRAVQSVKRNKIKRVEDIKYSAQKEVSSLIQDPFWLVGIVLYWGEGAKEHNQACPIKFTNMSLDMHKLFLRWVRKYLSISDENLFFQLFIHERADIERAERYWMKNLGFSKDKLKVYLKTHNPKTKRKRIGDDYFGVLSVVARKSIPLNRKIAGWVEGVVSYFHSKD